MITPEQLHKYLSAKGVRCLYCENYDIEQPGKPWSSEDGDARAIVHCHNCGRDWFDVYYLSNVEENS